MPPAEQTSTATRDDGPDRRERLLNLLAALLETRAGLTREELVGNPTLGYPPNPASARRAFERDKATLRAMGVPIRDIGDEAETRYRVAPSEYYLPDLALTDDELAALHVAVTAVGLGSSAGEGALMKLGGIEGSGATPIAELPFVDVLAPLFEASRRRAIARFSYRGRDRELEPWGLTSKFGHWYVVGFDRRADDMRVFRADRIDGDVAAGAGDEFTVPADFRADSYLEDRPWDYGEGRATEVVVRVDEGWEVAFCQAVGPEARVGHADDGGVLVTIRAVELRAVVSFVLGFLDHVEVIEPPAARDAVVAALTAWTGASA
jgi:proteasome accessory factor B